MIFVEYKKITQNSKIVIHTHTHTHTTTTTTTTTINKGRERWNKIGDGMLRVLTHLQQHYDSKLFHYKTP